MTRLGTAGLPTRLYGSFVDKRLPEHPVGKTTALSVYGAPGRRYLSASVIAAESSSYETLGCLESLLAGKGSIASIAETIKALEAFSTVQGPANEPPTPPMSYGPLAKPLPRRRVKMVEPTTDEEEEVAMMAVSIWGV